MSDVIRVVKLGGSLHTTSKMDALLDVVLGVAEPIIIVPGGGRFADAVRAAQHRDGFDDAAAHQLALAAMATMAAVICEKHPRFQRAADLSAIADAVTSGTIPVFEPAPLMTSDPTLPTTWQTTSDAIAARLAEMLQDAGRAVHLIVVKSANVAREATASQLAADGIVDPVFPAVVSRAGLRWSVVGADDPAAVERALGLPPGLAWPPSRPASAHS